MMRTTSPFCSNEVMLAPTGSGVLDGLRLGVKDVFDVAGHVTGCGNPDWQRTHWPAQHTASVIQHLQAAGATLLGKTATDELAYSLNGENWHYGMPPNPRAPGRIPGGSSSGSASAVAAGLVEIAIGTDCGGSVRMPASFCGLYGMRPTHGQIATDGLVPLAHSFDTVGWFANSADHLSRVGDVLLDPDAQFSQPTTLLIARDLFAQLGTAELAALQPALARLGARFAQVVEIDIGNQDPDVLMRTFRTLQAAEIWATHGDWITRNQPVFGPGIAERFAQASRITQADIDAGCVVREVLCDRIATLLQPDCILCLPSAPGIAPLANTPPAAMESYRSKAMRLLCIAGLAGTPQVSIPVTQMRDGPLGLSLMMAPGADRALLDFVCAHDLRDRQTQHDAVAGSWQRGAVVDLVRPFRRSGS